MRKYYIESERRWNIIHAIKISKANWIGYMLHRNCLLKRVIEVKEEGMIELTGGQGRRRKQLLTGLEERRGYWNLIEELLGST